MGLSFSFGKIPYDVRNERVDGTGYAEEIRQGHARRDYDILEEGNEHGVEPGVWMRTLACETLIKATMTVGLGRITKTNWMKFYSRLHAYEKLFGPFRLRREEDGGDIELVYFTPEEVRSHIGLGTNVPNMTDTKWWKALREKFENLCERVYERS